jgi:hypothetical protein
MALPVTDVHYRSLLNKAVRRGHVELVLTLSAMVAGAGEGERHRFAARVVGIVFFECWPLAALLRINRRFHSKVAALVQTARSVKNREAAGLGQLAWHVAEGARVPPGAQAEDRPLRMVAQALRRPEDFWAWAQRQEPADAARRQLVAQAHRYRRVGTLRERAVTSAAACLAAEAPVPPIRPAATTPGPFPYWVALDVHTPEGRRTYHDIARDLHIPLEMLEWVGYHLENAVPDRLQQPAPWWDRLCRWRLGRLGLTPAEAPLLWEPARLQIQEALLEESEALRKRVYGWKLAHLEEVEALRRQVEIFLEHPRDPEDSQRTLF